MGLPKNMVRVLDVFLVFLCLMSFGSSVSAVVLRGGRSALFVVAAAASLVALACWALWRRTGQPGWVVAVFVGVVVSGTNGDGLSSLLALVVGVALLTAVHGLRAGLLGIGFIAAVAAGSMVLWRAGVASIVVQTLAGALTAGMGVLLGLVLRELAAERRENVRLLAEVRSRAAAQRELVLADERARSARELHDGLGHRLTVIGMSLEYAERMRERDVGKAFAEVAEARAQATDALEYMRRWVRALNPPREQNLSGMAAFDAIAESFRGTGLAVRVHGEGPQRPLSQGATLFAYRLVQEGLTNVLRHSSADRVDITVRWLPGWVEIQVADNGVDRGGRVARPDVGFGLRSLGERARELGGALTAAPGEHGMLLVGRVPDREGDPA